MLLSCMPVQVLGQVLERLCINSPFCTSLPEP